MANHDSLEWSKTYPVLTISRLLLNSLHFSVEEINQLTEEDMWDIAADLRNGMGIMFEEDVITATYAVLDTKGNEDQPHTA